MRSVTVLKNLMPVLLPPYDCDSLANSLYELGQRKFPWVSPFPRIDGNHEPSLILINFSGYVNISVMGNVEFGHHMLAMRRAGLSYLDLHG
jgi:hypothetical protein